MPVAAIKQNDRQKERHCEYIGIYKKLYMLEVAWCVVAGFCAPSLGGSRQTLLPVVVGVQNPFQRGVPVCVGGTAAVET